MIHAVRSETRDPLMAKITQELAITNYDFSEMLINAAGQSFRPISQHIEDVVTDISNAP